MIAAKGALRYCLGTKYESLCLRPCPRSNLNAYIHADWAKDQKNNRRCRSGILIQYENVPVYASSTLQKCVVLSSTKAEYVALSDVRKVILWICRVLTIREIHFPSPLWRQVYGDSTSNAASTEQRNFCANVLY